MLEFDGKGPEGLGGMTGKGMGYCVMQLPADKNGQSDRPFFSRGLSRGSGRVGGCNRGRGFGRRRMCRSHENA